MADKIKIQTSNLKNTPFSYWNEKDVIKKILLGDTGNDIK